MSLRSSQTCVTITIYTSLHINSVVLGWRQHGDVMTWKAVWYVAAVSSVSPMMMMFGRALLQPGLLKYVVVAEKRGAHQGDAVMSPHEIIFEV